MFVIATDDGLTRPSRERRVVFYSHVCLTICSQKTKVTEIASIFYTIFIIKSLKCQLSAILIGLKKFGLCIKLQHVVTLRLHINYYVYTKLLV